MKKNLILKIYQAKNTVFSLTEIALLWQETNNELVKKRLYRYLKSGKLYSMRKGFYSRDKNYNKLELATKLYTPAYISLQTVLSQAGVIFQYDSRIFVASYLSREIEIEGQVYKYQKIKDEILTNKLGIKEKDYYFIADPERAFLDMVYLYKDYYFDNLNDLNWEKVWAILPIYNNKRMQTAVKKYYQQTKENL